MKKLILASVFCCSIIFAQQEDKLSKSSSINMLIQPITVTIGGDFIINGSFTAYKSQRLDHFITAVYTEAEKNALSSLNKIETIKQVTKELQRYALRDITLKKVNGEVLKIDLLKFRLTGDFKYNPYLMNDDIIIFPAYDDLRGIVDISGGVNKPTKFQFVEGDKLSDAIMFAGGINLAYENITEAEISRLSNKGTLEKIIKVKLDSDIPLERGDRITVLFTENNKKVYKALILGEVNRPGYVYITKNTTTIKDFILKAGGFTLQADLKRTELLKGTNDSELLRMNAIREQYKTDSTFTTIPLLAATIQEYKTEWTDISRTNILTKEEIEYSFEKDNWLRTFESRNIIDFTNILSDSSKDNQNIIRDGDIIIVPAVQNLIYVFGQIVNPGFYNYEPKMDWKYYIHKAGGLTASAKDEEEIQLIKGKNKTWYNVEIEKNIEPGDLIYIPKIIKKDFSYYLQQIGSITSIVSTAISLIFIIVLATK